MCLLETEEQNSISALGLALERDRWPANKFSSLLCRFLLLDLVHAAVNKTGTGPRCWHTKYAMLRGCCVTRALRSADASGQEVSELPEIETDTHSGGFGVRSELFEPCDPCVRDGGPVDWFEPDPRSTDSPCEWWGIFCDPRR